jgi:hypothetical protein
MESIQQRKEHCVVADIIGKGGHVRRRSGISDASRSFGVP